MGSTLTEIARQLKASPKKVQLIYAFNGTGKTRLSREFKQLIAPKSNGDDATDQSALSRNKMLYYNAFTEDLFYWDNDLELDAEPKLKILPNSFTNWILEEQGHDQNIIANFQRYANDKLTPRFNEEYEGNDKKLVKPYSEVTFSLQGGDDKRSGNLKISKGEESNFIWSVFYTLTKQVIAILNVAEPSEREINDFDQLEYVFVDDPVSSLDDNHLIQLALDLALLIKSNNSEVKFIITTHSPLFFNVLCNEFRNDLKAKTYHWKRTWFSKSRLEKDEDGGFKLIDQPNDSPFSYHLHLLSILEDVIKSGNIEKYHFNLLRNILEKTATFLGYKNWEDLLPQLEDGLPNPYANRILNLSSHSKHAAEEVPHLLSEEKKMLENLVKYLVERHHFSQEKDT